MEYIFTLLALWPTGEHALVRWAVKSYAQCEHLAMWYAATLRADGVDSIAWQCVQQFAV